MRHIFVAVVLAALAACGGKHSTPATPAGGGSGSGSGGGMAMEGMHHEGEHDEMSPELKKFHDALAPRWHAAKGPQRQADTCATVSEFTADADAIAKATPPTTANADTWTAGTRALVDAVGKLNASCKANDPAQFDTAFGAVHDAFHSLMGMAGMHHDEKDMGCMGGMGSGMECMHHDGMGSGQHKM